MARRSLEFFLAGSREPVVVYWSVYHAMARVQPSSCFGSGKELGKGEPGRSVGYQALQALQGNKKQLTHAYIINHCTGANV